MWQIFGTVAFRPAMLATVDHIGQRCWLPSIISDPSSFIKCYEISDREHPISRICQFRHLFFVCGDMNYGRHVFFQGYWPLSLYTVLCVPLEYSICVLKSCSLFGCTVETSVVAFMHCVKTPASLRFFSRAWLNELHRGVAV